MLTALIALWLIFSAFAWGHSGFHMANTVACGFVALALAIAGFYREEARSLVAVVAVWLFVSAVFTMATSSQLTLWNNALVAIALLTTSLAGRPQPQARAS
jgi:hypothetical protein